MHGAIINSGAEIGKNCIINSRALIEHDAKIESNCHISTGAIVNGNTIVKKDNIYWKWIGTTQNLSLFKRIL